MSDNLDAVFQRAMKKSNPAQRKLLCKVHIIQDQIEAALRDENKELAYALMLKGADILKQLVKASIPPRSS